MKTQLKATVVDGGLKLDQQVPLPDHSRVRVEIAPLEYSPSRFQDALAAWKQLNKQHPLHLGGSRFNRDELYDRG